VKKRTEKLKSKKRMSSEVSVNNPRNPWVVSAEEEKERLRWEGQGFAEKEGFKRGMKE